MKKTQRLIEKLKKDKRVLLIIAIGILGMLLLLFSETGGAKNMETEKTDALPFGTDAERELEERLEKLLSGVAGVGRVKVMVTFDGTWESIYARDGEAKDASTKDEYVIIKENGDETGLKIRSVRPDIKGVGVSCEGADSASVRENVTSLICASLGIPSNRVYVARAVSKKK